MGLGEVEDESWEEDAGDRDDVAHPRDRGRYP